MSVPIGPDEQAGDPTEAAFPSGEIIDRDGGKDHIATAPTGLGGSIRCLGEFVDMPLDAPPDLLGEGVLSAGGVCSLVGRAKEGKTWLALQLGLCVAGVADQFLTPTLKVHRHGPVLYVNAEMAEWALQKRLRQLLRALEASGSPTEAARRKFFPVTLRGEIRLDQRAGESMLMRLCAQSQPVLTVLDPLGALHDGDENSQEHIGRLMNVLVRICQRTGSAVLFVHHAGKQREDRAGIYHARGSSVFGDRVDSALTLVGEAERYRLLFSLRNGPPLAPLMLSRGADELLWRARPEPVAYARSDSRSFSSLRAGGPIHGG